MREKINVLLQNAQYVCIYEALNEQDNRTFFILTMRITLPMEHGNKWILLHNL